MRLSGMAWGTAVALAQAVATLILTGIALTVQLVVYPGLVTVGRTEPSIWTTVHAAHSRRITVAVGPPWLVQGLTCLLLPFVHPAGTRLWESLLAGLLGLASVVLTLAWAVPLHTELTAEYDDVSAVALLHANGWRLLGWAGAATLAVVILVQAGTF